MAPPIPTKDTTNTLKRSFYQIEKPIEAHKRKRSIHNQQPRWHNQAYMLFLALRQHPERTMARTDLIKSAISWDAKISEERSLPKVFGGKTPKNSASAILTNNVDRYFIPFKPDGSRSMHFKLSFEPGSFENAFQDYKDWQDNLVKIDWPYYFSLRQQENKKIRMNRMSIENLVEDLEVTEYPTEFDEFIAKRKRARQEEERIQQEIMIEEIPRTWKDLIVSSKVDNQFSLSAKRFLPKNIPLGFYFGVPMTEDEFDSLKGDANAMLYRKTVLDPTDDHGKLYFYPNGDPLCPFHCIRECLRRDEANVIFYEGHVVNQVICWTKRDIFPGEELLVYLPRQMNQLKHTTNTSNKAIINYSRTNSLSSSNDDMSWQEDENVSTIITNSISPIT
ncbi:uncharacterized protein BX663DRAFT_555004 [Cokeromyces recurvatus]|uniref:uncharacterized protein n=1 Tax=Cokeromyces recurvatus TaxID=90255 RepID=UPI00221F1175|nr:uncharacterized protein BX663DRAFT_555004 [Cokeromyces recurvatus]KAI7899368.1 hypothetical protein BX663DRAFT_555004 [Cokeromyces recurvatus]